MDVIPLNHVEIYKNNSELIKEYISAKSRFKKESKELIKTHNSQMNSILLDTSTVFGMSISDFKKIYKSVKLKYEIANRREEDNTANVTNLINQIIHQSSGWNNIVAYDSLLTESLQTSVKEVNDSNFTAFNLDKERYGEDYFIIKYNALYSGYNREY